MSHDSCVLQRRTLLLAYNFVPIKIWSSPGLSSNLLHLTMTLLFTCHRALIYRKVWLYNAALCWARSQRSHHEVAIAMLRGPVGIRIRLMFSIAKQSTNSSQNEAKWQWRGKTNGRECCLRFSVVPSSHSSQIHFVASQLFVKYCDVSQNVVPARARHWYCSRRWRSLNVMYP